jgi:hypothetical protein
MVVPRKWYCMHQLCCLIHTASSSTLCVTDRRYCCWCCYCCHTTSRPLLLPAQVLPLTLQLSQLHIQAIRRRNEVQKALQALRKRDAEAAKQLAEHNRASSRASSAKASHYHYPHPASPSALCPLGASTINIVVHWGAATAVGGSNVSGSNVNSSNSIVAGSQQRCGQHHVRNLVIRPQVGMSTTMRLQLECGQY